MGGSNFQLYDLSSGNRYITASTAVTGSNGLPADKWRLITVKLSGLTAETVTLQASVDGVAYDAIRPVDWSTGATAAASAMGNGVFKFVDCGFPFVKLVKSAGAETVTAALSGRA